MNLSKKNILIVLIICSIFMSRNILSAPIRQEGPMIIEGTIKKISWLPHKFIKGVPGLSGSLGRDRTSPARYIAVLTDTFFERGKATDASCYIPYKNGDEITVLINHEEDDGFLKQGMRIKIYDYTAGGDEGGTWTSFRRVDLIEQYPTQKVLTEGFGDGPEKVPAHRK